ncbi:MAG: sodium:solute symporter family protein [Candidatus Marinimicrobia bacterium]|nr:sodium:solute symporter family protein [Candidatus Neomarinimicrobiota bacterium]
MQTFHSIGTSADWIVMVVYFLAIMIFGSYFGRYTRSTTDFFFGGRRFSWWLITISIVATGVGSHSFVKYSAKGFEHGISSTMTYMNDWFFVPFFIFGWLPIVVYSKIRSIPEYFEKRFSPSARFLATILLLLYMIGYIGIGFLTLGKALIPMLPESFMMFGATFPITLMGAIIVIAIITGIYITYGGQTAVIFTDLLQGAILIFAGLLLFALGLAFVGGFDAFWNILPMTWKLPLADFNQPPNFNFVGIFWQDAIAGSIGFLFMNQGLLMRFMACKSVNEGRKAAAVNILFVLPVSAIVVGNAGWIGKAISIINPDLVPVNTSPDQIFVVVANIVSQPGVFGFVMAALTAALMSTVDTLINATAAIFINDVYRPIHRLMNKAKTLSGSADKRELLVARYASMGITALGVLAVLAFKNFPTVYEAHGYFHSTLTPPLVVAIFLGIFWKKFTPAAVITTFLGGVGLMLLGARYPGIFIAPFDHGITMNPSHPYSYIRALYNILVCSGVGVIVGLTTGWQKRAVSRLSQNGETLMKALVGVSILLFFVPLFNMGSSTFQFIDLLLLVVVLPLVVTHYVSYDEEKNTKGLITSSIEEARIGFKSGLPNDREGIKVEVSWKLSEGDEDYVRFSKDDMIKMAANSEDLVYLCDKRKWLGGLKSIHSRIGKSHDEPGIVYLTKEQSRNGLFVKNRILEAEKEM